MDGAVPGEAALGDREPDPPTRTKPRKRRSSAEVRELVIAAARGLFARRGYQTTTTRDIALEAGVDEATARSRW